MLRKIYKELLLIRTELQTIRKNLELRTEITESIDFLKPRDTQQ